MRKDVVRSQVMVSAELFTRFVFQRRGTKLVLDTERPPLYTAADFGPLITDMGFFFDRRTTFLAFSNADLLSDGRSFNGNNTAKALRSSLAEYEPRTSLNVLGVIHKPEPDGCSVPRSQDW